MNSWWSPSNAGDERPPSAYPPPHSWSSPPVNTSSNQPSPRRREHALQPPPLMTTALSGQQLQGLGVALGAGYASTPLSTTSLSSPFTQSQSPAVTSPGSVLVGSSPMASRQYNVPYNPQHWGPVAGGSVQGHSSYPQNNSNNVLRIVPQRSAGPHPDMSLSPPPPPYSPPAQSQQPRDHVSQGTPVRSSVSPSAASSYNGVVNSGNEGPVEYRQQPHTRTRPLSIVHGGDTGHSRQMSLPPPPPLPQGIPSSRSSSHNRVDVYRDQVALGMGPGPYLTVSQENQQVPQFSNQIHVRASAQYDDPIRPPTSRRAVSAGPIVSSANTSRATSQSRNHSPSGQGWEPGMPLPPPPPGPPPTARSQSVSGIPAKSSRSSPTPMRAPKTRPPPVLGSSSLGSIPPTPADWIDEGHTSQRQRERTPLNVDTTGPSVTRTPRDDLESNEQPQSSSSGLFRSPAIRDSSAKGIRERRVERRNRQSLVFDDFSAVSTSSNPWAEALDPVRPSNLNIQDANTTPEGSRQQGSVRGTPRSTHSVGPDGQQPTSRSRANSSGLFSNRSTPKAEPSPFGHGGRYAQTPPFSPDSEKQAYSKSPPQSLPPKALPTPPLHSAQEVRPPSRPGSRDRPVSHILHLPNDDALPMASPLAPRRPSAHKAPSLDSIINQDVEFVQNATQRHKGFIEREANAADEVEALRIFADYIITESQIRREKYGKVFHSGSVDLEGLRNKLFEAPPKPVLEPPTEHPALTRRPSGAKGPRLDIPQSRPESAWWNNYKPCLSPIASLSMSNDEMSSRGRAPSRWWESKSSSEGGERRIQRSKRESKYMGLPREAFQWASMRAPEDAGSTNYMYEPAHPAAAYGPDEYPPEKVGWHEDPTPSEYSSTVGHSSFGQAREQQKMDVSRLITLPPPYPRHHPAVNNSHPDLVTYRTVVRSISDLAEIKATRQRHQDEVATLRQNHQERLQQGRREFKANIQSQIQQGSISFAEAAEAEAALILEENNLQRELVKRELDTYNDSVLTPILATLTDRINRATACIDELRSKLFDDARHGSPDQTQEEGDEKPELLEKLTQLKWLFEARELLHRETFDLVSDRDEKYKEVVLLPYKQKASEEKIRDTTTFFVKDALDRRVQYEASALSRLESFLDVIEENVARGVEIQLSAFWDIAPSLLTLIEQIPEKIDGFQIQIPANEYEENPSYHRHPLQYLYTLLSHAEKSSYQYIESQINLFCLLHEVRSAVMRAHCKLMQAERTRQGEPSEVVEREIQASRGEEERAFTNDLKDKVGTVEGQWTEALGSEMEELRGRVKRQLMGENGWEDLEQLEET
ncbi:hypothetical protein FE257_009376 [Aspergillus nanangensis]|uniref:Uncharacterized protein n=1 Tax=Aspergillus nanangensis TaxID=2582783 RepID=A0AAD4CLW3_ASPNN|nr:hypothetical protein FE257_009376 [Aspergillus nanangensis]